MNSQQADVLRQAWLNKVPQLIGELADGRGGYCALGLLLDRKLAMGLHRRHAPCPECGERSSGVTGSVVPSEALLIVHYNNDHKFDFLTIANKLEEVTP